MRKARNQDLIIKIALRIKKIREKQDITQEVFYNDTGINIGRIECAKRDITMTTLNAICNYLNVSLEEFFKGLK